MNVSSSTRQYFAFVIFACSACVFFYGAYETKLWNQSQWTADGKNWLMLVAAATFFATLGLSKKYGFSILVFIAAVYLISFGGFSPLVGTVLLILGAYYLGEKLFDWLKVEIESVHTESIYKVIVGLAIILGVTQFIVRVPVNYPSVYIAFYSIIGCLGAKSLFEKHPLRAAPLLTNLKSDGLATWLLIFAVALNFIVCIKPEVSPDGLSLRLWIPTFIETNQQWRFSIENSVNAFLPNGAELLFTAGYFLGDEIGARLLNLSTFLASALLLYFKIGSSASYVRRLILAAFISTPLIGLESGSLFVEHIWTMFLFGAGMLVFERVEFHRKWTLIALLLSAALATKVITVFTIPIFLLVFFSQLDKKSLAGIWKWVVLWLILAFAIGGAPYLSALYYTGNPVFPFMNDVFKAEGFWSDVPFTNLRYETDVNWITLIYDLTFYSPNYIEGKVGTFGFHWLLFTPAALFCIKKGNTITLFSVAMIISLFVGVFPQQAYLRYILPALPFAVILLVTFFNLLESKPALLRISAAVLSCIVALNIYFFSSSGWNHTNLVDSDFNEYVKQHAPERVFADYLNRVDPKGKTLFVGRFYSAGFKGEVVADNWYFPAHAAVIRAAYASLLGNPAPDLLGYAKKEKINYVISSFTELKTRPNLSEHLDHYFDIVFTVGDYVLYVLPERSKFGTELALNTDFQFGLDKWLGTGNLLSESAKLVVMEDELFYQRISVIEETEYLLSYRVACDQNAQLRLQVNWSKADNEFISTSINVEACDGTSGIYSKQVRAPKAASFATIYAMSHNGVKIAFEKISLMR
jgi:hypothetical protein